MKIRILDRILVALAGLLMLAVCVGLAAQLFFGKDVVGAITTVLTGEQYRIWLIATLAIMLLLGCYCILILFRHHGRRDKFVMQKTENGELSISLKAMESMVQKCLDPHKELSVQGVRLENQKGGLLIRIRGTAAGGVSIPLTVDALQQQIKQYVTACSGVEVKNIRIQIESSGPETTDSLFAIEAPTARALPGGTNIKEDEKDEAVSDAAPISEAELEQISADIPAPPVPNDAEEENPQIEIFAAAAAAAEMLKNEAPPEDDDRPIHQRLFSMQEEPCVMPMPPAAEEKTGETPKETAVNTPEETVGKTAEETTQSEQKEEKLAEEDKKDEKQAEVNEGSNEP